MKRNGLSDRVMQAFNSNIKEQQALEKTIQAIGSQENHFLKLMELSNRETRIRSSRLKKEVSRIRSNLTEEQITQLQKLEKSGRMRPMYNSVKANGSHRIAQAANRLKLEDNGNEDNKRKESRSQSIISILMVQSGKKTPALERSKSALSFSQPFSPRRSSQMPMSARLPGKPISPLSQSENITETEPSKKLLPSRASTSLSMIRHREPLKRTFSSHDLPHNAALRKNALAVQGPNNSHPKRSTTQFNQLFPEEDFESPSESNQQGDLRQELLEQELNRSLQLRNKQMSFMRTVAEWVKLNANKDLRDLKNMSSVDSGGMVDKKENGVDEEPEVKEKSLDEQFMDLRKVRYLRIADELVDLSGVVTLVKDQKLNLPGFAKNNNFV